MPEKNSYAGKISVLTVKYYLHADNKLNCSDDVLPLSEILKLTL
jgi:hypothetical protein